MKLSLIFLLPVASVAFSPSSARLSSRMPNVVLRSNELDDACAQITDKTEEVLDKADGIVTSRVMRFVDHAPMLFTLKGLADKAGMAVSRSSINAAPAAFEGLTTALPVPGWCFNVWAVIAIAQVASIAKSALADGGNELSQADISSATAANFLAMRAVASANPLRETALTALVSGYALRKNGGDGSATLHKSALQLMSSFTTVLTVLGCISAAAARLSFVNEQATSILGVAAYYIMATRSGNGTTKKVVNAGVLGGIVYARIAAGVSLSMDVASVVSGATTVGAAFVAYEAINRLRKAVMA